MPSDSAHRIVIVSLYKPQDDPRMYEKYAGALKEGAKFEIFIIGRKTNFEKNKSLVQFIDLNPPERLSLSRIFYGAAVFRLLRKLRPDTVIFCTHELILQAVLYKLLRRCILIYDVQENYFYNLLYTKSFVPGVKQLLAWWVRFKELICLPWIDGVVFAEQCYVQEMPFLLRKKHFVLPNVFSYTGTLAAESVMPKYPGEVRLVYAGTVAREYGIMEALELVHSLRKAGMEATLLVVGYAASKILYNELKKEFSGYDYVLDMLQPHPVPHGEVLREMKAADFGLLAYTANKSYARRVPTKLYEFTCLGVPMLVNNHPASSELVRQCNGGVVLDFTNFDAVALMAQMTTGRFYTLPHPPDFWFPARKSSFYEFLKSVMKV